MNKEEIKQILLQNNLIVKKKYGQNFLLDEVVLNNIILKAGIKADSCVVEIGPGLGFLTKKLSQFAGKVLCYEIDEQMVRFLKKENYNNVEIIQDDFLNRNLDEDFLKFAKGKNIALFGSYGWGDGEWMREWESRMLDAGANVLNREGLICHETPDDDALEDCRSLGKQLASL